MARIQFSSIIILTLVIIYAGCKEPTSPVESKPKSGVDSVEVFLLKKETIKKQLSFPAELIPLERAEIVARVSGYVKTVKVDIGDRVQKGQVLLILEAPEMQSQYATANADVQTARSRYLGSMDTYARILNAAKVDGTIAANELEKARTQMLADSATLEASRSKLNTSGQLKDYLVIRAPFNGIITQRNADPGTLVGAANTKPLLIVEDNSILRLRVALPEAYVSAVPDTNFIQFSVAAQPGNSFTAKLSRKSGTLNLTNRTESWEYLFTNKAQVLKSGMFANANLLLGRASPSFLVPTTAIVTTLEKRFVIRLRNYKTEWVDVSTGITIDNKTEIFGQLAEGDSLLKRGTDEIKPGIQLFPKY